MFNIIDSIERNNKDKKKQIFIRITIIKKSRETFFFKKKYRNLQALTQNENDKKENYNGNPILQSSLNRILQLQR
jgi:hypothetical protein